MGVFPIPAPQVLVRVSPRLFLLCQSVLRVHMGLSHVSLVRPICEDFLFCQSSFSSSFIVFLLMVPTIVQYPKPFSPVFSPVIERLSPLFNQSENIGKQNLYNITWCIWKSAPDLGGQYLALEYTTADQLPKNFYLPLQGFLSYFLAQTSSFISGVVLSICVGSGMVFWIESLPQTQ